MRAFSCGLDWQGLKPKLFRSFIGPAEAVPWLQNRFFETRSSVL
jgi:hypothetical protein